MAGIKKKGMFQSGYTDVRHNPSGNIITDSVMAHFKDGTPVDFTIAASSDIRDFVFVQTVKGGATYQGSYVGKVVRFYYSIDSKEPLVYKLSNNKVPKSENSKPLMDLTDSLPHDLDKRRYANEALKIIREVGVPCESGRNNKAFKYMEMGLNIVPFPHKGVTVSKPGFDFSGVARIGIQTGYRANTIGIRLPDYNQLKTLYSTLTMGDWSFYTFNYKSYPGTMASVSKKLMYEVMYGRAIEMTHIPVGVMQPLPPYLESLIFENLSKAQRTKILDRLEFLL